MCCHHAFDTERFLVHRGARNLRNSSRAAIQGKVVVRQLAAFEFVCVCVTHGKVEERRVLPTGSIGFVNLGALKRC